jgi:integrase
MANLVVPSPDGLTVPERAAKERLRRNAMNPNTVRTYTSAWRVFARWCAEKGWSALPASADTLVNYVAFRDSSGCSYNTVSTDLAAIHKAHERKRIPSARYDLDVKEAFQALGRSQADRPKRKKAALTVDLVAKLIETTPETTVGLRDRAILLVGVTSAMRRSNLASLDVSDITPNEKGLLILVKRSKTDQFGKGKFIQLHSQRDETLCPARALRRWLLVSGVSSGKAFRRVGPTGKVSPNGLTGEAIYNIVVRACERAGLTEGQYSAHSLRAGFITSATENGKTLESIMETTGHRDINVARGYIRHIEARAQKAGEGLFDSVKKSG